MSRPEHSGPPELYYNESEAQKYTRNSRIIQIQIQMCERALELLLLPENEKHLILDIGCGSGLSGSVLEEHGHNWIGIDISPAMLKIGAERNTKGDLMLGDMGHGVPFKAGTFDGAISISALQWLCNLNNSKHILSRRLDVFFSTLFASLSRNARAVFQYYPENDEQVNIITTAAIKAGFFGGTVVDYPNSKKAKKIFLVLMTNSAIDTKGLAAKHQNNKRSKVKDKKTDKLKKLRHNWILEKKERYRKKGKKVKMDSKYTGRKRKGHF